jgi:hypothetical protein
LTTRSRRRSAAATSSTRRVRATDTHP